MRLLVIRADAGPSIGIGHVMRAYAVAEKWASCGNKVVFLSNCESDAVRSRIASAGFDLVNIEEQLPLKDQVCQAAHIAESYTESAFLPWVMLDGYDFASEHEQAFRNAGMKVLLMDDLADRSPYYANLVVNACPFDGEDLYVGADDDVTFLLGSKYIVLREEFSNQHERKDIKPHAGNVLVTLGGADPVNFTEKVLRSCATIKDVSFRVIVGSSNRNVESLEKTVENAGCSVELLTSVGNIREHMQWADVAVCAGGQTSWELACSGVPLLMVEIADNQKKTAAFMHKSGVAVNLGEYSSVSAEFLGSQLESLLDDVSMRRDMSEAGRVLVDGLGGGRLVDSMLMSQIVLRNVNVQDSRWVWELACEPNLRKLSFCMGDITWDTHEAWFEERLADGDCVFLIAETDKGQRFGQVRFERNGDNAEVSVSITPSFRGMGIGRLLIKKACDIYSAENDCKLMARIKEENVASRKAFQAAGFALAGDCVVNNTKGLVYSCSASHE